MALRVVGVGLGRTGTHSLKLALEQLVGGRCHHMVEVYQHLDQMDLWTAAAEGRPDWDGVFAGYVATVDWPGAGFWRELVAEYPDAAVLLSMRESADAWWNSAERTIFEMFNRPAPAELTPEMAKMDAWRDTMRNVLARNGVDPSDAAASKKAYERHLVEVRTEVPSDRLVGWTAGEGWEPLCDALRLPVPDAPFPHVNTTEQFRSMFALDA